MNFSHFQINNNELIIETSKTSEIRRQTRVQKVATVVMKMFVPVDPAAETA